MIDFKETRGYVQNILAVRQAYRTFKPHWADSMAAN
jgi:soluble lytic murein transglycosylase-like protein